MVLDRRQDKTADTGQFELAYKQTQVSVPPYIGINLTIEGQSVRRPPWLSPKKGEDTTSGSKIGLTPRPPPLHVSSSFPKGQDKSSNEACNKNGGGLLQKDTTKLQLTTINLASKSTPPTGSALHQAALASMEASAAATLAAKAASLQHGALHAIYNPGATAAATAQPPTSSRKGSAVEGAAGQGGSRNNSGGSRVSGGGAGSPPSSGGGGNNKKSNDKKDKFPLKPEGLITALDFKPVLNRQTEPKSILSKSTSQGQMDTSKLALQEKEDPALPTAGTVPLRSVGSINLKEFHQEMIRGNGYHKNWIPNTKSDPLFPLRRFKRPPPNRKNRGGRKLGSLDMPVGIQLPEEPNVIIRVPQVPYLNLSIAYRLSRQEVPRSKLIRDANLKTLDRIRSSVSTDLEKKHEIGTTEI